MPPGLMPVRSGNWRKSGTGPDHNPAENRRRARSVDFSADFRTPPLWGVGASGPPYLHDGSAHDLAEAIGRHDGEARNTRLRWEKLPPEDRDALIRYLQAL